MTRRRMPMLLAAASVALVAALVTLPTWAIGHRPGPIYTVSQVVNGALLHPKEWDGRMVQVHAIASVSLLTVFQGGAQQTRAIPQILLFPLPDPRRSLMAQDGMIRLLAGREDSVLALLRHVPLIGGMAPHPQRVSVTHAAIYQIRIHLASQGCNFSPCIAAVLVDAASVADPAADLPYGS